MRTVTKEEFFAEYLELRKLWGNKNATWDQCVNQLGKLTVMSIYISDERVETLFEAAFAEWNFRGPYFLLKDIGKIKENKVQRKISKFPYEKHYYVTFKGDGVDISEKFNTEQTAEMYANKIERKLKTIGKEVEL